MSFKTVNNYKPNLTCFQDFFEKELTLVVYLAMSAATSADVVGIWKSPAVEVDDEEVTAGPAMTVPDAGVLVTRVTADEDVLCGESF